ncbi:MAG: hypothetical protein ACUVWP_08775 [bacterium]
MPFGCDVLPNYSWQRLGESIGCEICGFISFMPCYGDYKLVVFAPEENSDEIKEVLFREGAGVIRRYSECSFMSLGVGTFKPEGGTSPYYGKIGKKSKVNEERIEVLVSKERIYKVVSEMLRVHPYESPMYDIYCLVNINSSYSRGALYLKIEAGNIDLGDINISLKLDERIGIALSVNLDILTDVLTLNIKYFIFQDDDVFDNLRYKDNNFNTYKIDSNALQRLWLDVLLFFLESKLKEKDITNLEIKTVKL